MRAKRQQNEFAYQSSGAFLRDVLARRMARKPRYSLRAMARDVGISPSHLSEVMRGQKKLSPGGGLRIARRLALNARETDYFRLLVEYEASPSGKARQELLRQLEAAGQDFVSAPLDTDAFEHIADWWHVAILEMTALENFVLEPISIARRLGIKRAVAEAALERLLRLGYLQKGADGTLEKAYRHGVFASKSRNDALRRFHSQMLERAASSLDKHDPATRFIGSRTFSIDPQQLPEASRLAEEFLERIAMLFDASKGRRTATYHLGVQLFNLAEGNHDDVPQST